VKNTAAKVIQTARSKCSGGMAWIPDKGDIGDGPSHRHHHADSLAHPSGREEQVREPT